MLKRWNFWAFLSVFFPSIAILGVHAYLGSFNRFIADDFCSAYFADRLGFFRSVWFWYLTWFGTYSAGAADSVLPLIGIKGISYTVLGILVIWSVVVIWAIAVLWPKDSSRSAKYLAASSLGVALVSVALLISPNVPQSLYWWGGMRAYIPPLLLATFNVVLFQKFLTKKTFGKERYLWFALSFIVSFIMGGFSETFTPVQVVFFVLAIGWGVGIQKIEFKNPALVFLIFGFVGSLAALFVMILAPGNAQRQEFFPESHNLFKILSISLTGYIAFFKDIFGAPDKVAGLAGITLAAIFFGMQIQSERPIKGWIAPVALLAGLIFVFGCFPSAAYGMEDVPPTRTLVIPAYFFVISLLVAGVNVGQLLQHRIGEQPSFLMNFGLCASVLVLMSFSAWVSGQKLYSERQRYSDYAAQWDQANAQIIQAKAAGDTQVTIPAMSNWAGLDSPNDNPKFWVNYCYSKFYDIDVRARPVE